MPTAFAGLRGTGDWGTDERPKNFREWILWANPNGMAPLTALMSRMASESVNDPEFSWFEELLTPTRVQINYASGFSTTANTITIAADGLKLVPGQVLQVEKTESATYDNELVEVSSVTSDTVVVIKRGVAGSTAAPLLDGAHLTVISSAYEEGSGAPAISQRNPTKVYNYTQIFKTSCGITGTAEKTKARTGNPWENDKNRKSFDHSVALELAFMFGRRYEDLTGSKPKRYTGGLRQFLTTNTTIFTTTPTEDALMDAIYPIWDYSVGRAGDERIAFCGNGFLNSLNRLARNSSSTQIQFRDVIKLYGMNLTRWILPQGTLAVKTHPLMNMNPRYTYSCFIIDPTGLKYRHLPGRDTTFFDNVQDKKTDSREGLWLTECGLEVHHERTMAYIGNFVV